MLHHRFTSGLRRFAGAVAATVIVVSSAHGAAAGSPGDTLPTQPADDDEGGTTGIGIAPAFVEIDGALRGNEYVETLILLNNTDGDRRFTLAPEGDHTDWISFRGPDGAPIDHIDIPHQGSIPLDVVISIPDDTANATYRTAIDVGGVPLELVGEVSGSDAVVSIGALVPITIVVGGDMVQTATFDGVTVGRAEVGQPVEIAATFNNTGNVGLSPLVEFAVSRNGQPVDILSIPGDDVVPPGRVEDLVVIWDTSDTLPGDYVVDAVATADGYTFETRSAEFRIDPAGTVERSGELVGLELVNLPLIGNIARVRAEFRNASDVPVSAVFVADVELDGVLVGEARSLEVLTRANDVTTLDATIEDLRAGTYVVRGKVNFEGRETDALQVEFEVTTTGAPAAESAAVDVDTDDVVGTDGGPSTMLLVMSAVAVAALAGLLVLLLLRRRRRSDRHDDDRPDGPRPSEPMRSTVMINGDEVLAGRSGQRR